MLKRPAYPDQSDLDSCNCTTMSRLPSRLLIDYPWYELQSRDNKTITVDSDLLPVLRSKYPLGFSESS